jgi:hypothetical protein
VKEANLFPGKNTFPFDPTQGPGYVWHCHILDHEDNDMMRPMTIVKNLEPCLNCETMLNDAPGNKDAGTPAAARYSTPTTKPAHDHNGSTPTTGGTGTSSTPMPMPMPMPEQK